MKYIIHFLYVPLFVYVFFTLSEITQLTTFNHQLLMENQTKILDIYVNVVRIDLEQQRRQSKIDVIPSLQTKLQDPIRREKQSGILTVNIDGVIQNVSLGIESLLSLDEDELVGVSMSTLMSENLWEKHKEYLKKYALDPKLSSPMEHQAKISSVDCMLQVTFLPTQKMYVINIKEI
jgi:hypothetical protein